MGNDYVVRDLVENVFDEENGDGSVVLCVW